VTSSKNPSNFGDAVTFTATVSGSAGGTSPTGTVTFTDLSTGQTLGTATLNISQQATVTTSSLSTGSHNIQASYDGDGNFGGSSATLTQVVNKAATTTAVTASPNPSVAGQPVTFTAMVSPTTPGGPPPTGTVTFLEGGNPIGSATLGSNGQAALTIATPSVGSHTITASYPGDGNFNPSSGSVTQLVNKNGTTTLVLSSANPSTLGQSLSPQCFRR
jgi:large repetitive protein